MSLFIHRQGLLDTIQDLGRYGYQHLGINTNGAMDSIAMQIANALLGNTLTEPVLEMHFPAAVIEIEKNILLALAGADFSAEINGESIPMHHPILVQKGAILRCRKNKKGARIYLAVAGGYLSNCWLNSNSTQTIVKQGGFQGKALHKNDRLPFANNFLHSFQFSAKSFITLPWFANPATYYTSQTILFIPGAEYHLLNSQSAQRLENSSFTILPQSDRMGYRLKGENLALSFPKEMISSAVTKGTLQLLPDGQLIILLADHQTTGGYPRIGHIISAHIATVAQMCVGEKMNFQQTDLQQAETLVSKQAKDIQLLQRACRLRLEDYWK